MRTLIALVLVLTFSNALFGQGGRTVNVSNDEQLKDAIRNARAGDTIRLAAGKYGSLYAEKLVGQPGRPITFESATSQPAEFVGGRGGIHLSSVSHVTLRNLVVRGASVNGINIDDGGKIDQPSTQVLLDGVKVFDVGPRGNFDGIKLSGLEKFELRSCHVEGWGGSAVDMVGCHDGLIAGCTFRGKVGFSQDTGVQAKGGSRGVTVRQCRFDQAGQRAVNIGGSTGLAFFRPRVPDKDAYEAKDITVEGCTFIGSMAPIAFVGCDGATVRYNTFYRPQKWLLRILQETTDPRFLPCRNGRFENNLIVFHRGDLRPAVNVGPNTEPGTFRFTGNFWFCADAPADSKQQLTVAETNATYGVDPKLRNPSRGDLAVTELKVAAKAGAEALPAPSDQGR